MESQIWEIVNNIVPIFRPSPWSQLKNELTLCLVSQFWINFWPGLDLMNFPIAISYPKRRFPLPNRINFWKKIQMAFDPPPPSFLENYVGNFYRTRVRSLAMLVTNWLTHWLLFSKLDWCDPGCEDANSKLVEVVTVDDVDDENRVGNSLLQIWKLRFGQWS